MRRAAAQPAARLARGGPEQRPTGDVDTLTPIKLEASERGEENAVETRRADPKQIADEAVGERPGSAAPDFVRAAVGTAPQGPDPRAPGAHARLAERSAEAMGERAGGAYADATIAEAERRSRATVGHAPTLPGRGPTGPHPAFMVLGGFALGCATGYAAALLVHRER
jgi:hypothetical protein